MVETRKCPLCGGTMVPSKVERYGYSTYFWIPPWKSKVTGILNKAVYGRVWLCLDCGALIPYVDGDTVARLREEFETLKAEGKA
ncbi:hypothetical protein CDI07_04075 [Thermococcus sp. 5-4]|nr:hypothetical protein CDI07_04075 [Thermococcus sp. 5-4]